MIAVSDEWKDIQARFLLPETFVEIDCSVTETEVQESATISGTNEALFSNTASVLYDMPKSAKYATNELNLWALDGTRLIVPDSAPYADTGYVSEIDSNGSVKVMLPELHTTSTAGVTITWAGRYGEYPTEFTIVAKRGETVVKETVVTDNRETVCAVFSQLENYDNIEIVVNNWSLPYRRARIESVIIGHVLTFKKNDIFSFSHEQAGHLNSGELPKNSITFTLDNTDGRWNPNNPTGVEQYLSERQRLKVRYGMDVNGIVEWIKGGTFYLSEWRVPTNGLEASFVARDIFEYLLNETYTGGRSGTLYELIGDAIGSAGVPNDVDYILDDSLKGISGSLPDGEHTCAEVVQMCANAGRCVVYQDREGVLHVKPLDRTSTGVVIPLTLSYSHPEIELSKPLKSVSVSYGGTNSYVLPVSGTGDTQTVNNALIGNENNATNIAVWVRDTLSTRKTLRGEYRADPRLDVFDIVSVQSKYGEIANVAITDINYTYSGSFKGSYVGRVLEDNAQ